MTPSVIFALVSGALAVIYGAVLIKLVLKIPVPEGKAKGIALAIERETKIPIKFIGTGEGAGDFAAFDATTYLQGLFQA